MKLNERSVAHYATCDSPPDKTGFLFKKGERNTAYHRRWFVLKGNMLFYFEERESREPIGVIVLEGCTVELCESAEEFAFAVKFDCAKARVYKMASDNQAGMESWVKALSRASFDYMRLVENGVAWSKPAVSLANGFAEEASSFAAWEACSDSGSNSGPGADGVRAPPVPRRRRGASLESPVSPGTGCFSKLHDWYGKEVEEVRVQWLQSK
ncbi:hypothetical protein F7725_013028 [Dissostichus mawsoni]|uniref:Sesquipedalian n=1 Tax=Dissostichus mawsoni TaxID=36200 RepID=A0A7J5YP24_DISMA|nr:hypothetical protein F7725_013028 [Dissostichus mawsoni]